MNEGNFPTLRQDQGMQVSQAPEVARVTAEVQARKVMAKRFPRDQNAAFERIVTACKRKSLAESALYAFKRGGQMVTGPSIHLLKAVAQQWGNLYTGWEELERREGVSKVRTYAHDDESGFTDERVFIVPHVRDTSKGPKVLTEERDVYELIANMVARRQRACLMSVIPVDVVEAATRTCEQTLTGDGKEPLQDRVRNLLVAFKEHGVTPVMIATKLGHALEAVTSSQFVGLYKIYRSIADGVSTREEWFQLGTDAPASSKATALTDMLKKPEPQAAPQPTQ